MFLTYLEFTWKIKIMEDKDLKKLLELLNKYEDEIIEYKVNNKDHERIGKYISALANSAAMLSQ